MSPHMYTESLWLKCWWGCMQRFHQARNGCWWQWCHSTAQNLQKGTKWRGTHNGKSFQRASKMGDKKIWFAISCRPGHGDLIASDSKECGKKRRLGRIFGVGTDLTSWCFFGILCRYLESILRMQTNREKAGVAEVTLIMITRQWNSVYALFFSETWDANRFVAPGNYAHFAGSLWRIFFSVIQVIRHITCAERLVHRWICLPLHRFHPARLGICATRCMAAVPQPCGDAHGCREDWAESARLCFRWFGEHRLIP